MSNSLTHCFLSHDWGVNNANHQRVVEINRALRARGLNTWIDEERLGRGDIMRLICDGIDHTQCVLVFGTQNYQRKVNSNDERDACRREFNFAYNQLTASRMFLIILEEEMLNPRSWTGFFAFVLGNTLYFNCTPGNNASFEGTMDNIAARVRDLPPRGLNIFTALPIPSSPPAPTPAPAPAQPSPSPQQSRVISIGGNAGVLVDRITFTFNNNQTVRYGNDGGNFMTPFSLRQNEVIVGINGTKRAWASHPGRTLLGSFRVTTSLGQGCKKHNCCVF